MHVATTGVGSSDRATYRDGSDPSCCLTAVVLVGFAVLAVGVLGTLLSVRAAQRQAADIEKPHVSLQLRPPLRMQ
jgi:hypothetical protein